MNENVTPLTTALVNIGLFCPPQESIINLIICMKKLLLLFAVFSAVLVGCSNDNNEQSLVDTNFKQGWKLLSMKTNGADVVLPPDTVPELMYFGNQNVCYLATPASQNNGTKWVYTDVRTAWNYDFPNKILNISALLPVTYYVDVIQSNRLAVHYYVYNTTGGIDNCEKEFQPQQVKIVNLKIRVK